MLIGEGLLLFAPIFAVLFTSLIGSNRGSNIDSELLAACSRSSQSWSGPSFYAGAAFPS
jgi:hypothetical protein